MAWQSRSNQATNQNSRLRTVDFHLVQFEYVQGELKNIAMQDIHAAGKTIVDNWDGTVTTFAKND
jgi:hypothetical protein